MFSNGTSLADIAAVTRNDNSSFGGDGWWVLIILFALFGGFGNGGFAGNNQSAQMQQGFDSADVNNKLNSIGDGICSLGYDQLQQLNAVNQNVTQTGYNISTQLAQCCCETQRSVDQVKFDMSNYACNLGNQIQQMGQTIMINDNNNYRALHDQLVNMQMQQKDERIAELTYANHDLRLAASQAAQTDELTRRLIPAPIPAYQVQNPYASYNHCGFANGGC